MYSTDGSLPYGYDNPTPQYHEFSVRPSQSLPFSSDKAIYNAKLWVRRAYMTFCKNNPR